jgi:aldose 1-epimerase
MIALRAGAAEAVILPEAGGALTRLTLAGRDLVVPVPADADPNRGFHGAFLMAPWTNRLDGGRIVVDGAEHRMPINRPDENTALHGFCGSRPGRSRRRTSATRCSPAASTVRPSMVTRG